MVDAGGLFKQSAPLFGAQRKRLVDQSLADDGVRAFGQTAGGQQVGDIFEAHFLAVEDVFVFAGAVGAAADFDFGVIDGQPAVGVVQGEDGLGHAGARACLAASENHVGGAFAA